MARVHGSDDGVVFIPLPGNNKDLAFCSRVIGVKEQCQGSHRRWFIGFEVRFAISCF